MKLGLDDFKQYNCGAVISSGVLPNSPEGIYMTNNRLGDDLLWVAIKGYGNDWAIYCYWSENGIEFVKTNGDKIHSEEHIQKCVPCTEEVYNLYRR